MKSLKKLGLTAVVLAASAGLFGGIQNASAREREHFEHRDFHGPRQVNIYTPGFYRAAPVYQPRLTWVPPVTSSVPAYDEFGNVVGYQTVVVRAGYWAPCTYWSCR